MRVTPELDSIGSFPVCMDSGVQCYPDIAFGDSSYLVFWSDKEGETIEAARVTPDGAVLDTGNTIGGTAGVAQPAVAFDGGRFIAVWSTPDGVRARFVGQDGLPADTAIALSSSSGVPAVAFDGTNYLAMWPENVADYEYRVVGQLISPSGSMVGDRIVLATEFPMTYTTSLCHDGYEYLAVWWCLGSQKIWGQRVSESGNLVGSNFRVSSSSTDQMYEDVTSGNGKFLVTWTVRGGNYNIYGNLDNLTGLQQQEPEELPGRLTSSIVADLSGIAGVQGKKVRVFDISGKQIGTMDSGHWNAGPVPTGIYFVQVGRDICYKVTKAR